MKKRRYIKRHDERVPSLTLQTGRRLLDRIIIRKNRDKQTVNHWEEMVHKVVLLVRGDAVICRIVPENVENPKKESFIEPCY